PRRIRRSEPGSVDDTNDESEEGDPFDQSGGNDHRGGDRTGGFGLTSHALNRSGADLADAVTGTDDGQGGAEGGGEVDEGGGSLGGRFFLGESDGGHRQEHEHCGTRNTDELLHLILLYESCSNKTCRISADQGTTPRTCMGLLPSGISGELQEDFRKVTRLKI